MDGLGTQGAERRSWIYLSAQQPWFLYLLLGISSDDLCVNVDDVNSPRRRCNSDRAEKEPQVQLEKI